MAGKIAAMMCFLAGAWLPANGQTKKLWHMLKHADSLMMARYHRGSFDTAYITRPKTRWTLTGRINVSETQLELKGMEGNTPFRSEMTADYKSTVSFGVNYLGLAVSLSLNPAKLLGRYDDYELKLNSYGNKWGFDFVYQDADNFNGWYEGGTTGRIELPEETLKMKSINLNAYYVVNHRRFSYPAAFSQSYIQRRSAGSLLIGASGQWQWAKTNGNLESVLKMTNIGIGAGYAYNWVPARHWLLHISALPTFIVYSNTSLRVDGDRVALHYHFPEVIITARGAIVRQFGNMFVGMTTVFNFSNIGNHDNLAVFNRHRHSRLFVGFRL